MKCLWLIIVVLFGVSSVSLVSAQEFEFLGVNSEIVDANEVALVRCMAYSWDGTKFAAVFSTKKGHQVVVYTGASSSISIPTEKYFMDQLSFTKEDILIGTSGADVEFYYPMADGQYERVIIKEHSRNVGMYVDPNNQLFTLLGGRIYIWPIMDRESQVSEEPLSFIDLNKEKRKIGLVVDGGISPDGRWLVCGTTLSGEIIVVDMQARQIVWRGSGNHKNTLWGAEFTPDGRWLATLGAEGVILLWDIQKDELMRNRPSDRLKLNFSAVDMVFVNNHQLVVVGGQKLSSREEKAYNSGRIVHLKKPGRALYWDIESGAHRSLDFPTEWEKAKCVVRSPRGLFAVGSEDGRIFFFRSTVSSERLTDVSKPVR